MNDPYLSDNFKKSEFSCKCGCGLDDVDLKLVEVLQGVRDHFGKPVVVTSGLRCVEHNDRQPDSSKRSHHLTGKAADIIVRGVLPKTVQKFLMGEYLDQYGIGVYPSFTHIDVRIGKGRW